MHRTFFSAPSWVSPGASADLDSVHGRAWAGGAASFSALLSCTRASAGLAQKADGSWMTFAPNALRMTDQGLLVEEARTNLFLNSSAPVTQTIPVSSTGSYTMTCWGASGSAIVAAGTATGSGFGAAAAGRTGTQRIFTITGTGTITVTVSGPVLYVQVEGGAFGTSPIMTGASATGRAADVIQLAGGALSAAQNAKAARFVTNGIAGGASGRLISDSVGNNSVLFTGSAQVGMDIGGSPKATANFPSGSYTNLAKTAAGFDSAGTAIIVNGSAKGTNSTAWTGFGSSVYLGGIVSADRQLNGYLLRASLSLTKGRFDSTTTGTSPQ